MQPWRLVGILVLVLGGCLALGSQLQAKEKSAAERGRDVMVKGPLNPPAWSRGAYENLWKQWGLKEKPANYPEAVMERYGMHPAPFDNHGLPLGLMEARHIFRKGVVNNCLLCHANNLLGQTVLGAPNPSVDLQSMMEDLFSADGFKVEFPVRFSMVRGTVDPVGPVAYLMQFRDADMNIQNAIKLPFRNDVSSDPPAWWLLKRKKTRDWTGGIDARSTRVDMGNLLSPLNTGDYIRKQEPAFADIGAFILQVESPKYPFPIDEQRADQGKELFVEHCVKCHGTYGSGGHYPNKIVPLQQIGTDPTLAQSITPELIEHFNKSWLGKERSPDGGFIQIVEHHGYQAPPLDGVWATAPYLHNGSAPTVYHVLNSKARPKYFTRSYRTAKEDYDVAKLGWKTTTLERPAPANASGYERRKVYDTTQPGCGNSGHTFGDKLSEDERLAVIEYLKTL